MPDFNNLNPILINPDQKLPNLPSPSNAAPNNIIPLGTDLSGRDNGHPIFGKGPQLGKDLLPTVTAGELYENRRYNIFDRSIVDIEDQNANAQSVLSKATNGILKGANLAATTVAGSFGMLYGAAKSPFSGRLADIWDNPVMQKLDEWNTEVDQNYLPNYYTNQEKNAAWYSTDNWMKANFLFDKLIKNSGFAVGAMLSGNIANAGLKAAGAVIGEAAMAGSVAAESSQAFKLFTPLLRNTARAFSAGKNIEAASILEKGISSIADVEATASQMAKIAQTTNKIAGFSEKARRTAVAVYSSSGESAFEALQTSNEYRNNLIAKYREDHFGQDPKGAELENINTISESVGKTSFFGNLALLSVTEYVQLPKLLGSSYAAEKQAANSLLGTADNVLLKEGKYVAAAAGATTRFGKIYEKAAKIGKYVFDPKEAGQELGQYALQVGTQNYFNKAYKGQEADAWTDGFLYGMVGENEKGEGVGALVSKEGMESAILGGLTGGGMQAIANYGNDAKVKSNTAKFIEQLNGAPSARDAFKEKFDAINRGVALQEEEQQAILQGEQLEARDLKRDQMHNYLAPRIKYGRFDMIMDDINELRQNGMTEDGLAQLKEQGIANINDTVQSFQKRLTNFEQTAKDTNELYKSFDLRFAGETLKDADGKALLTPDGKQIRKYSPLLIDKMVYAASKVADYDVRIPQVSIDLITNGIDAQGVINDVLTNDASTLLPKTLNEIDETSNPIIKDKLKEDLKDSVELAARRKFFLAEYEDMKNNPQNYDYTGEKEEFTPEGKKTRTTAPDASNSNYFSKSRDKFKSDKRTYADLVNQYGEGERSKYDVLKKIVESPYATVLEKRLASEFLKYTPKDSKIILGDRTLSSAGVSRGGFSGIDSAVSSINYEDNAADYENGSLPVEHILLHEIGHDLTVFGLSDESGQFYKELNPLFNFVKDFFKNDPNKYAEAGLIKDGEYYAFKNIREFATEALSNREFQRYLQTIPYAKTQTSVWDTFIDSLKTFFRRLFGTESDTALDEVVAVVTNNIDSLYKNVKEKNEKLEEEEKTLIKNRAQLTKEQNNLEKKSGSIGTIPTTNVTSPDEPALKDEAKLFTSGTTESEGYSDPTNSAPHITRSREFLNNAKTFKNRGKMKAILVTPNQEDSLGLTGLAKLSYGENDMSDSTNVETGLVVQVFVIQEKGKNYFVDKNGNKLTEVGKQVDLNEVIFQTMPTTKLYNSKGNPRFRSNQAAEAKVKSKAWSIYREQLFNAPAGSFPIFDFLISRGIPIQSTVNGVKETNQVGEVLIPEIKISTQQGLITIPTTGSISHNGEVLKFPNGVPVLQYGDTVQFLNNRKFNDRESNGIFQVIKNLAEDIVDQSNNKKTIKFNAGYASFLQNVLYWRAGEITSDNQIRINVDTMSFQLGNKEFALTEIASNEKEIVAALKETFNNVNNDSLTKNFNKPFVEYYINQNGEFTTSEWDNYQTYLLSSTYPSGGKRPAGDTPLTTSVAKPTAEVPYSFQAKYATLQGLELPVQSVVAEEAPVAEETEDDVIGGYKLNNEVVNTYPLQNGDVQFKGSIDADGNVSVTVLDNDTIKTIADNKKLVNDAIVPALKAANRFNATADDAQLVLDYVALRISADLQTQKDAVKQEAPKAEEAVQPIAPPEVVAQQELEAKKADIEKLEKQLEITKATIPVNKKGINSLEKQIAQKNAELADLGTTDTKADIEKRRQEELNNILSDVIKLEEANTKEKATQAIADATREVGNKALDQAGIIIGEVQWGKNIIDVAKRLAFKIKQIQKPAVDKINAKYDAELAALEGVEQPKEAYDPKNTTGPSTNFRKVGVADSKERISDAELQLFKQWHAENIPNIPYEALENLITDLNGEKNWGVFEDGVAKFFKGGLRGTEYHEIGEAIWKGMLSPEERQAILDDERLKAGTFVDRESGKTYSYDDPKVSDQILKERIMDDFSDYRLGKLPARSLGERVRRFFKSIMDFFKSFVAKPSLKEDLFKAIDTGKFKERTLRESVKNEAAEYRAVAGLTEQQTHEFVQDMTARAAGILYSESKKNLLFSPDAITSNEMFGKIEQMYATEGKMEELGAKAWAELKQKTKENLRTLGINFNNDDVVSINDENANKNDYAPEPFSTDWKKNSTGAIKFSLATLLETSANNQENSLQLELPQAKESSIKGYRLLNFSRAFATVLDKLANTTSVSTAMDKLLNLANYDSNYVRLWSRVGGSKNKTVPFESFDNTDWRYFIQFMQTFTKQKPDALVQYISGSEVYTAPANLYTAIKETQQSWVENIKTIAQGSDTLINYDKASKKYKIDVEKIKEFPIKTPQNMVEFLSNIGVEFSLEVYNSLKTNERNRFAKAVSGIYTYLGENNDIMTVTNKTLGINGQLSTLAELLNKVTNPNQDSTYFGVEGQRMGSFSENNAPSVFENEFNEADTLDELLEKRPELNDMFSANSQILKKGGLFFDKEGNRIKSMKVKYIQGTKNLDNNKGFTSSKLGIGERFTQEINQNLNGDYYVLIPADGSTEWMMELGNPILFSDIDANRAWDKINKVFKGYLIDDVALALDADNRKQLKNVGSKAKELRFFKDILAQEDLEAINEMINDDATQEQIEEYINENIGRINDYIKAYIDSTITETRKTLVDNNQIVQFEEDAFSYVGLDDEFMKSEKLNKFNLSDESINNILTFANVNYIINNIEYHKVLFGDPYQFKIKNGQLDETKRIKSFLSPRRTTFDTPEYNTFLNQEMNTVNGIQLNPGDPGYHQYKAYTNTLTAKDVTIAGSLSNIIGAYAETNEADAMSWLMDNTYKEIKMKNGQWSDEAEAWHQWQMAWTRQNLPGYNYSSTELENNDKELTSKEAPKHTIEVLKPIVSGNKFNKDQFDLVLDKFSQMPIYYSMVKGTNLEKLYVQMMNQGYGYAIVESGRKVGAEKLHSLYNTDGSFNEEVFNNTIQVPWKAYGIQVETTTEGEKTQTRGSQLTKLSSIDLFDNGVATSEAARKEYIRNTSILNDLHENAYNTLLTRLGVVDLDNGFALEDGTAISETLMYEMMRRELSDNAKDTIQLDENNEFRIPFEASPSYSQIRSILYSMVNKSLISPTMNGGAHVQVPATMFESLGENRSLAIKTAEGWKKISKDEYEKLSDDEKKSVLLTDDSLKFYSKENPYCEVMLPHWFKEKFAGKFKNDKELLKYLNNTQEGRSILTGIGFRIPTQAMSSIEVFKVKGFLPQYMGATVVVPSEITTKAGSDFDIDKLNMYLKSVYADRTGAIKLVKYQGSEEATKEFFGKVFDDTLAVKQMKKIELIEAVDIIVQGLEDPKGLVNKYGDYIKSVQDEYDNPYDFRSIVEKKLSKLTDSNLQSELRNDYVNEMYKKSLENEYYDSLEKLMTLPENFTRLISPVNDAGLKGLASRLNTLRGYDETGIKNRILDRNYMTKLRSAFVTAKKWVGIAAVNITNLSLKQKSKIYINPERFENIDEYDRILLGDGKIVLKHNTVDVNGIKYISLSGTKVKDSEELISNRLSGYATSFVDVAKDPYILDIIQSNLVIGTFMFLENVGAGEQAALFLNQPIISEYLKMLDAKGSKGLFNMNDILTIKSKFVATQSQIDDAQIDVEVLSDNISQYYEKGYFKASNDNAVQHVVLDEFLKYAKMAQYAFKFTQATNYDTTRFGSGDELMRKQLRTDIARGKSIISSVDDVLNNTFIGKQERFLSKSTQAMGAILKLEQDSLRLITDDVLRSFAENEYMSADDFNKISNKVKSAFLDYIIQTKTGISDRVKELLVDNDTAVVNRLEQAKKDYPNLKILNDLSIVTSDRVDGAKSIKLKVNLKDAYDENLYTGMMRELRDYNDELNALYKDIIAVAILQGSYQSAISIKNILPIEDYAEIVTPVVEAIVADENLQAFAKGMFQRNNFSDDTIVPSVAPKFFEASDVPTVQLDSLGNHYADVYTYYSPNFPNIKGLGIKSSERKVLLLSQKYNSFYLKNDFVKVPRVVVDKFTGDSIDMKTGLTITKMDYALMKLKGDPSLKDVYGYAKVKLPNGEPLIAPNEKVGDQHVYKLINLYGDGNRATENYEDFKQSVIDNGTVQIVNEIPDADLIEFYGGKVEAKDVSLQAETPVEVISEQAEPGEQLDLFEQEDESWEEEDNNDTCNPF